MYNVNILTYAAPDIQRRTHSVAYTTYSTFLETIDERTYMQNGWMGGVYESLPYTRPPAEGSDRKYTGITG